MVQHCTEQSLESARLVPPHEAQLHQDKSVITEGSQVEQTHQELPQ